MLHVHAADARYLPHALEVRLDLVAGRLEAACPAPLVPPGHVVLGVVAGDEHERRQAHATVPGGVKLADDRLERSASTHATWMSGRPCGWAR